MRLAVLMTRLAPHRRWAGKRCVATPLNLGGGFSVEEGAEFGEEAGVLVGGADGDADFVGDAREVPPADEDVAGFEGLVELLGGEFCAGGDGGEEEVGVGVGHGEPDVAQGGGEAGAFGDYFLPGGLGVLLVLDGGGGGGDGDGVDGVGVADFFELFEEGGLGDGVAEAEAGEGVAFGEGAEEEEVGVFLDERDRAGGGEVDVGFVDDEEAVEVLGDVGEAVERVEVAGGGVGVDDQ